MKKLWCKLEQMHENLIKMQHKQYFNIKRLKKKKK